jgi:hypothetical protein
VWVQSFDHSILTRLGHVMISVCLSFTRRWHRWVSDHLLLFLMLCCCFVSGCATTVDRRLDSGSDGLTFERRCRPVEHVPGGTFFPSLSQLPPLAPSEAAELSTATGFSLLSVETAHAFDVLPLLAQMPALERAVAEHKEGAKETLQEVRSQIVLRIMLASFQTNSINAEIMCEAARAEHLADYLQQVNEGHERLLTIIAVVTGGLTAIVGGGLWVAGSNVAAGYVALVGGSLETGFGAASLFQDHQYHFRHPRNLLREIWEGPPVPALFPDVIWRFLNRPLEEDPSSTLRTAIIARWRRDGRLGTPGSAEEDRRISLLFGEEGDYNEEDLRARAQMFYMLQSQVGLTSEYLEQFMRELLSRPTR